MSKKTNISSEELNKCAKAASSQAVKDARDNNVSYTVQEGKSIVRHKSDGTKTVVGSLAKAYVKRSTKRYRVA